MRSKNDFWEQLYQSEYHRLFYAAYRQTGNRERAEDLVQEVFLLAFFHREEFLTHPNPKAWLTRTLFNRIANEQRRQFHKEVSLDQAAEIPEEIQEESLEELLPVQLRAEEREILIWRYQEQIRYSEMAERLGVSESTCRKKVSLAINRCRKIFRKDGSC